MASATCGRQSLKKVKTKNGACSSAQKRIEFSRWLQHERRRAKAVEHRRLRTGGYEEDVPAAHATHATHAAHEGPSWFALDNALGILRHSFQLPFSSESCCASRSQHAVPSLISTFGDTHPKSCHGEGGVVGVVATTSFAKTRRSRLIDEFADIGRLHLQWWVRKNDAASRNGVLRQLVDVLSGVADRCMVVERIAVANALVVFVDALDCLHDKALQDGVCVKGGTHAGADSDKGRATAAAAAEGQVCKSSDSALCSIQASGGAAAQNDDNDITIVADADMEVEVEMNKCAEGAHYSLLGSAPTSAPTSNSPCFTNSVRDIVTLSLQLLEAEAYGSLTFAMTLVHIKALAVIRRLLLWGETFWITLHALQGDTFARARGPVGTTSPLVVIDQSVATTFATVFQRLICSSEWKIVWSCGSIALVLMNANTMSVHGGRVFAGVDETTIASCSGVGGGGGGGGGTRGGAGTDTGTNAATDADGACGRSMTITSDAHGGDDIAVSTLNFTRHILTQHGIIASLCRAWDCLLAQGPGMSQLCLQDLTPMIILRQLFIPFFAKSVVRFCVGDAVHASQVKAGEGENDGRSTLSCESSRASLHVPLAGVDELCRAVASNCMIGGCGSGSSGGGGGDAGGGPASSYCTTPQGVDDRDADSDHGTYYYDEYDDCGEDQALHLQQKHARLRLSSLLARSLRYCVCATDVEHVMSLIDDVHASDNGTCPWFPWFTVLFVKHIAADSSLLYDKIIVDLGRFEHALFLGMPYVTIRHHLERCLEVLIA